MRRIALGTSGTCSGVTKGRRSGRWVSNEGIRTAKSIFSRRNLILSFEIGKGEVGSS